MNAGAQQYTPPAKDVLQTFTGKVLKPLDPWPGDFDPEDIAWSLSQQCRYNGHTALFYSVATHCRLVAHFLPPHLKLEGLLHDASEAYLSDLPAPVKHLMPEYQRIEAALESVIATQFHLVYPMHPRVKWADDTVFQLECALVMGGAIEQKFALPRGPERDYVEKEIIAACARGPEMEAKMFMSLYRSLQESRGYDVQRAHEENHE